ncbi:FAD-dependent oxidoreductase [Actinomadura madurae]|uniref:FAD-dependent oxidoreductase n=1 Tax=Actinomadura madurae TaxID=1993 RepID=UPI0027E27730|nr:FAD-dependent oxidoreductase [Actinomadura madurae]
MTISLADAAPEPFWLQDPGRPDAGPALTGAQACDLAVVGGGYSGLWTALLAKERDPSLDVVVLEGGRIGAAASGRNGGSAPPASPTGWRTASDAGRTTCTRSNASAGTTSAPSRGR